MGSGGGWGGVETKGGRPDLHMGGQEDGIAMKGAQSKVKWGADGVGMGMGGGAMAPDGDPMV